MLELIRGRVSPNFDDDPVEALRQACADLGIPVSGDGHVLERDAARLLNRSPHTLKNWRDQSRPLEFRRLGNRAEYSLSVLACFLAAADREERS